MSRATFILALFGFVLSGLSLWIAGGVSRANTGELERIQAARADLEQSLLSMGRQIAELRSNLDTLAKRQGTVTTRTAMSPQQDPDTERSPGHLPAGTAAISEGPSSDTLVLAQRYRALSDDAKKEALEDLAQRARWGDKEALQLVLDGLSDASPKVREKAAKMLGDLADPALFGHLKQAASDPSPDVRSAVAESLEELPAEDAGPILIGMLNDEDPEVVSEAIKSLSKLDYAQARPYLTDQLGSEDLDVATRAASALRGMGDEGAALGTIDRIMKEYGRADVEIRIRDVKWLRRVGGATAIAQLKIIMDNDPSLSVREEARDALVKLGV